LGICCISAQQTVCSAKIIIIEVQSSKTAVAAVLAEHAMHALLQFATQSSQHNIPLPARTQQQQQQQKQPLHRAQTAEQGQTHVTTNSAPSEVNIPKTSGSSPSKDSTLGLLALATSPTTLRRRACRLSTSCSASASTSAAQPTLRMSCRASARVLGDSTRACV